MPASRLLNELPNREDAAISISVMDIENGEFWEHYPDASFHAASTMKVCVLVELFRQAESGVLNLSDSVKVRNEFRSIVDGSTYSIDVEDDSCPSLHGRIGEDITLIELAEPMITQSSNLATNLLVDKVGASKITETMRNLDCTGLNVLRGVEDGKAYRLGLNNTVCAGDLTRLMAKIALGTACSAEASRQMVEILLRQEHRGCIPAVLLPEGIACANKTGWQSGICHDTAIVFPAGRAPYVVTVLTSGLDEASTGPYWISRISEHVYRAVLEGRLESL